MLWIQKVSVHKELDVSWDIKSESRAQVGQQTKVGDKLGRAGRSQVLQGLKESKGIKVCRESKFNCIMTYV